MRFNFPGTNTSFKRFLWNPGIPGIYTNGGKFEAPFAYQKQIKAIWYNGITIYNYGIRDPRQTCPSSPPLAPDCPPARPKRTVLMAMVVMTPARKPSNFQGCAEKMYQIGGSKDVPGSVGWWKKPPSLHGWWSGSILHLDAWLGTTWMKNLDLFVDVCLCLFIYIYSHISFHIILVFQSVIKGYQEHQHHSTSTSHLAKYLSQL